MATIQTKLTSDNKQHDEAFKKSKQQVYNYNKQVDKAKSGIKQFAVEIAGAVITIETFKKIMSSTERTTDIFGSAMEQAKAAATGFFSTIANGNIGGFIESLKDLTKNAKDAYEALDALGTDKMWANRRLATIDAQLAEAKLANDTKKINVLLAERASIIKNLEGKTEDAFISSLISEIGNSDSSFNHQMSKRMQDLSEEDKKQIMYNLLRVGSASDLEELTKRYYNQNKQYIGYDNLGNMNNNIQTVIYEFYKQLKDIPESQLQLILALQEDAERLKRDNAKTTKRYSSGSESTKSNTKSTKPTNEDPDDWKNREATNEYLWKMLLGGQWGITTEWKDEIIKINEEVEESEVDAAKIIEDAERRKQEAANKTAHIFSLQIDALNSLSSAFSTLGNAFESDELNIASIVLGAIANIAKAYSEASAKQAEGSITGWDWLAFSVAGLAQVAGVIAQIHSLTGYANGGIIGGNSYTGDKVLARVNSGEMILNPSQQANLFNMINGGISTGGEVKFRIEGSTLVGVLNNYTKKTGRVL